jgi:tetratricopeptide (TPR) repeat protein
MTPIKRWPWLTSMLVGLCLIAGVAHAEEGAEPTRSADEMEPARKHFDEAKRAFSEGRYREAIELFRRADRAAPRAELEYNIAIAYEEMGNVAGALEAYRAYLRRAPQSHDRHDVERYIVRLEQLLAKQGVQQVSIRTEPEGATIFLDGAPVGLSPWTGEIEPGRHQLVTRLCGYQSIENTLDVSIERATDLTLTLEALAFPQVPPQPPATTPLDKTAKQTGLAAIQPVTWTLLGVGALSLVGAGYFELSRADAASAARNATDPVAAARNSGRADARRTTSLILLGTGAGAMAVGGVLVYLDVKRAGAGTDAKVALGCGMVGCGINAAHRF